MGSSPEAHAAILRQLHDTLDCEPQVRYLAEAWSHLPPQVQESIHFLVQCGAVRPPVGRRAVMTPSRLADASSSPLAELLTAVPPGRRGALMQCVVSFRPSPTLEESFAVGELRAAFAQFWEAQGSGSVPIEGLRCVLDLPVPIGTVLESASSDSPRDLWKLRRPFTRRIRCGRGRLQHLTQSHWP
jgi:hypothetical protein